MIVRTYDGLAGTKRETELKGGLALTRRFLLEEDGVGFSLCDIRFGPYEGTQLWYKNHVEANYVIEGEGILEELDTGITHELKPGVMYCLNKHERHRLISKTPMRVICVFNPPLKGGEVHDEDGSYPAG